MCADWSSTVTSDSEKGSRERAVVRARSVSRKTWRQGKRSGEKWWAFVVAFGVVSVRNCSTLRNLFVAPEHVRATSENDSQDTEADTIKPATHDRAKEEGHLNCGGR